MKRIILLFLMMLSSASGLFAQAVDISGTVTDKDGVPLPGVSILVTGTMNGTISDINGKFVISTEKNAVLRFSFVGMQKQEVKITDRTDLSIVLLEDVAQIGEVVVVGYGSMKKESLTAAISNIKSNDITTTTHSSLAQSLEGKIPGLQIRQNTGEPGSFDTRINIRGFGTPLFIIDGVAREGDNEFQRINPEDIESISVLKDGAAAIYGLRAANGVIIVTTKKGKEEKTRFTYHSVIGFQKPTDIPRMASALQYVEMVNNARINAGGNAQYSAEDVEKYRTGAPGYEGTDWYEATFKNRSFQQQHNLTARGGNDKIAYFASFGYSEDQGLLKSNDLGYNKYTFRTNLTAKLSDHLKADIQLAGRYDMKNEPSSNFFNIFKATRIADPTVKPFANDNPDYFSQVFPSDLNSLAMSERDVSGYSEDVNKNSQSSVALIYEFPFVKGLSLKGLFSFDFNSFMNKSLDKSYKLYTYNEATDTYTGVEQFSPTRISDRFTDFNQLNIQTQINYQRTFKEVHDVAGMLVYEQNHTKQRTAWLQRQYDFYTNDQIDQAGLNEQKTSGNEEETGNLSFIGRFNYGFKSKYLLEFAFRYDGSYRYSPNGRWGFFPVVTAGWRMSEESFLQNAVPVISNLKLRASYGVVGEDAGDPFQYVEGFTTTGGGGYEFENGIYSTGASAPSIVNPDLTWFTSRITNIGLDLGLWKNSLSFEFDVYQRYRTGLLAKRNVTLPNTFGGVLPEENLNSDRVRGIEASVGLKRNLHGFYYEIRGNFNYYRTMKEYVERGPFTNSYDQWRNGSANRYSDIVWGYVVDGQFQDEEAVIFAPLQDGNIANLKELPGDFQYKDMNGDGVINGDDMMPMFYNATPKMYYGLTLACSWKGFDLTALLQGSGKYTVRFKEVYAEMFAFRGNTPAFFYDAYTQDENGNWTSGEWPPLRYNTDVGMLYAESEVWRKDATYLRLKSVDIGYTLRNKNWMNKIGVEDIRLYCNGHNLFTFTDKFVKPFDPEKIEGSYDAGLTYPLSKSYNIGINITF